LISERGPQGLSDGQFEVVDSPENVLRVNCQRLGAGRPEERAIADEIDHPGSPVRGRPDEIDRGVSELNSTVVTGDRQPVRDVRLHVLASEWHQLAPDRHALAQLAHRRRGKA
jgi:hypothetical protein